jgi:hypothetical protein
MDYPKGLIHASPSSFYYWTHKDNQDIQVSADYFREFFVSSKMIRAYYQSILYHMNPYKY